MTKAKYDGEIERMGIDNFKDYETEDWELVYDFQKSDSWDKKYVTVKIYTHTLETLSNALVIDNVTGKVKIKSFSNETCESDALRWANDTAAKIVYGQ